MDPIEIDTSPAGHAAEAWTLHTCAVFRGLADCVLVHRPGTHRVIGANPAAQREFGDPGRQIEGAMLWSVLGTDDHTAAFANSKNGSFTLESKARHGDGTDIPVELRSSRIECAGETVWLTVVCDVTERVRAQERSADAERIAREIAEKKSAYVAAISHELRTPMNGILGMSALLLESPLNTEQRECADTIHGAAETLLVLLNEILDLSKIEAGRLEVRPAPFSPEQLCKDTLRLLRARAQEQGLQLEFEQLTSLPRRCRGDGLRLHQILLNLLGNAVKFTPAGRVVLRVRQLGIEANRVCLRFEVEDTGIGMSADVLATIFEPFSQAKGSSGSAYGGTGLGLTISQRLLQLMDSRLEVHSTRDRGTTFWFELWLDDLDGETERDTMEKAHGDLLYVGAHGPTRETYVRALARRGYAVEGCDLSATALERVRRRASSGEPYRAVFVERQLPDLDGETLGRSVRNRLRIATLPLYLVTSPDRPVALARATRSGFVAVLDGVDQIADLEPFTVGSSASPDAPAHAPAATVASPQTIPTAEVPVVLVVEDNPVNQKVVCHMLRKMGFAVELAEDGQQGVERLRNGNFDLVLMDCQMPVMDGYEATRSIRSLGDARSRIPVVALTANAMEGDREKCLAAGMDDYLSKPAKAEHLRTMLQKWIPACEERLSVTV
jgi:two-component system, sensor histidine kinase and response regulator